MILLAVAVLFSCGDRKEGDVLRWAEACMEAHPDSALRLLGLIPHPEELRGRQQADYALLLTQARDKNYLDSLQSDSLIGIAAAYYKNRDDDVRAGKSFFYYGKVAALQHNDSVAMRAYLNARKRLEGTGEYGMLAKVYANIGFLNKNWKMYDTALEDYGKAVSYYEKTADTLGLVYMYRNIAWVYKNNHEPDSSYKYVKTAVSLLEGDTLAPVYPSLLQLLGEQEKARGNYAQAIVCFQKAIRHERVRQTAYHYYLSLGDTYLNTGQLAQAEACFRQGLTSGRPYAMAGSYHYLHLLEKKRGHHEKALFYKGKSDSLLDVARSAAMREELVTLQKESASKNLRERFRQEKRRLSVGGFLLFVGLGGIAFWGYLQLKRFYKRQYRRRHSMQIEALEQRISVLQDENRRIKEEPGTNALSVLVGLRKRQLLVPNLSVAEQKALFEYVNSSFDDFLLHLSRTYKMNDKALMLAALLKLGFSNEELAFVLDVEPPTIRKKKQRLKAIFGLEKDEDLETFLYQYPPKCHAKRNTSVLVS